MTHIVLRDLRRTRVTDPFGGGGGFPLSLASRLPPEPQLDLVELDRKERSELMRDPTVVAIARPMPVALIRPVADAEADPPATAGGASWGIAAVRADSSAFTGDGTVVAVLDTGIDRTHSAFAGMTLVEQDFTGTGDGDGEGHGTHTSGTIFGRDVDGTRIGIARGVSRALIGKVLDDKGAGSTFNVLRGLQWAIEQDADVISMSLGFDFPELVKQWVDGGWPIELATAVALESYRGNMRMFDAVMAFARAQEVLAPGNVVVAAAGNESRRSENPDFEIAATMPAAAEGVLSVAALDRDPAGWAIAPFSNTFPQLSAPGVAITSAALGGGLRVMSGTSMACPHVAGVAALWWEFARKQGLPPRATSVHAKTLATARTEGFAPMTDVADRGVGIVTAP